MSCFKRVFRKRKNAINYLKVLKTRGLIMPRIGNNEGDAHAYRCLDCGKWHVGHKNNRFPKDETITRQ